MSLSHQLCVVGVGVLFALGQATPGVSQSTQTASDSSEAATQPSTSSQASKSDPDTPSPDAPSSDAATSKSDSTKPEDLTKPSSPQSEAAEADTIGSEAKQPLKPTEVVAPKAKPSVAKPATAKRNKKPAATAAAKPIAPTAKPINLSDFKAFKARQAQTPQPATPAPGSEAPPTPVPGSSVTQPVPNGSGTPGEINQSKPIGPAKPGLAPNYLNPDANPLYFPTKPEEVQLRGIQPITLQQALELGKRNNRELQVAILQRDRSRAALREQQAALYPSLGIQSNLRQSGIGPITQADVNQAGTGVGTTGTGTTGTTGTGTTGTGGTIGTGTTGTGGTIGTGTTGTGGTIGTGTTGTGGTIGTTGTGTTFGTTGTTFSGGTAGSTLSLNASLALSYDVYTSGRRPALIRAAERQLRSDQLQVEVIEQQLRFDVATDYYDLQESDEAVRIQQSAVRNAEASLRDTQALERAGLGTRFDVLQSQVQLARTRQDLTNALATQQVRRRELAQRLAVPPFADLAAADPVAIAGSWTLTLPQSIVTAFKNRAELEQLLAQRELSEQQRRAALATLGPTVSLQVQYGVQDALRDTSGFGDSYSVAAGVNWNFFDGGAARSRARQQEANKAIAETRFAQSRESIQLQVETAFTNLQSSFLNIGTNRQAVAQAREALRLARLRFQAGVGIQTEVINAENALINAEGNLVTAVIGYNRALASLERAVTNLPIATSSTTPSIPGPAPTLPPL